MEVFIYLAVAVAVFGTMGTLIVFLGSMSTGTSKPGPSAFTGELGVDYDMVYMSVTGVTHSNTDGTVRQDLIAEHVHPNDVLKLVPEPDNNRDRDAIKVMHANGQLGYVPRQYNRLVEPLVNPEVVAVLGGEDGLNWGVEMEAKVWKPS